MQTLRDEQPTDGGSRNIGILGTIARVGLGLYFVGSVVIGHLRSPGFGAAPFLLGLIGFPLIVVTVHWLRVFRDSARFVYTSGLSFVVNGAVFFSLWLTWWYAPQFQITSDAALLFYGSSMMLAAWRGYEGCEVLVISNLILRRDDQIGCALFFPLDQAEIRVAPSMRHYHQTANRVLETGESMPRETSEKLLETPNPKKSLPSRNNYN